MRFLMNFGSPGRPRGAPEIDFFASFFDFFARLLLQSCSWGLLGPFRVDFSSIFRRFWHDFWSISSRFFVALLSVCCASWVDFGSFWVWEGLGRFKSIFSQFWESLGHEGFEGFAVRQRVDLRRVHTFDFGVAELKFLYDVASLKIFTKE